MDYLPGGDFLTLLENNGDIISESMASFYLLEIAVAINELHNIHYIHRFPSESHVRFAFHTSSSETSSQTTF